MKISRICISTLLLVALVLATGWWARYYLLQNHVIYLLNQKEPARARELITRLNSENQTNDRTRYLMKKVLIVNGEFQQAEKLPRIGGYDAEMLYWEAVAAYHSGQTDVARARAQEFLESGERLPDATSHKIAMALAGEKVTWGLQPDKSETGFIILFDVEKAVCFALAGQEEYARKNFTDASQLFERALCFGYRDAKAMKLAAKAAALDLNFQRADLFLNFCETGTLDSLYQEFLKGTGAADDGAPVGIDLLTGQRAETQTDYQHALSWILPHYVLQDADARGTKSVRFMTGLAEASPDDAVIKLGLARVQEISGLSSDALFTYEELRKISNSLDINLKCWALAGQNVSGLGAEIEDLIKPLNPLQYKIYPEVYQLAADTNAAAPFTLEIKESGIFAFTVVAHAKAEGLHWPLLELAAGDGVARYFCMSDKTWASYTITLALEPGVYPINMRFASGTMEPLTEAALCEIKAVLVTRYDIK